MKILVTGGAGFIGSHIVEYFQGKAEIRVIDNLRSGLKRNLASFEHDFIEASILNRAAVRKAIRGVDYVFHLAAMISVPESVAKPVECVKINNNGTLIVLEEAAKAGVKKLILSSSAAIYGNNPVVPKVENMFPEPQSPYGITKLADEYYCGMFLNEGRLQTACLRYFNVFGPRQNPQSPYAAAVPIFIHQALKNNPITIYGDGEQTRDFIYVKDIASANAYFATQSSATGVFNVAYGKKITINELCLEICKLTRSSSKITYAAKRSGDVRHSVAAVEKIRAAGYLPAGNIADGLQATVDFFTGNSAGDSGLVRTR